MLLQKKWQKREPCQHNLQTKNTKFLFKMWCFEFWKMVRPNCHFNVLLRDKLLFFFSRSFWSLKWCESCSISVWTTSTRRRRERERKMVCAESIWYARFGIKIYWSARLDAHHILPSLLFLHFSMRSFWLAFVSLKNSPTFCVIMKMANLIYTVLFCYYFDCRDGKRACNDEYIYIHIYFCWFVVAEHLAILILLWAVLS